MRKLIAVCALLAACGSRSSESHHVRPLPKPDVVPALLGNSPARSPRIASYMIAATLDAARHQLHATSTLHWTNAGTSAVDRLPFHLYLNAFKNESSLFMQSSGGAVRSSHASTNWGWIDISSVKVGGVELVKQLVTPKENGADETVVELPLTTPVQPGESIDVAFAYDAQLPEVWARTGYEGEFHLVGQWFPKIGVRTNDTWDCRPFHSNSEFFADFGNYDVTLTVPNTDLVAATGVLASATDAPNNTRVFRYHAEDVHDFVWLADPYMESLEGTAYVLGHPVQVRVLYRPEQADYAPRHLGAAIGTIEQMSTDFVPYAWSTMTVVDPPMDAADGAGGMEYPTFVTTGGDTVFARPGMRLPEYVTVHEVGHNWFQGMLASNEAAEAWLDEGVNEWADAKIMGKLYGARTSGVDWHGWDAEIAALRRAIATDPSTLPSPIATAAYAFSDFDTYGSATYDGTMRTLATLEGYAGSSRFDDAMKVYAHTWAFKHPTGRDLFAVWQQQLGEDLSWFIGPAWQQVGGSKLALLDARCRVTHPSRGVIGEGSARRTVGESDAPLTGAYACEVVVTNTGTLHVPVDIDLTFADGTTQRVRWDDRGQGAWQRFVVERSSPLAQVAIDPDRKNALAPAVSLTYRLDGDGGASLRAAAWAASGAQTLMQIGGL